VEKGERRALAGRRVADVEAAVGDEDEEAVAGSEHVQVVGVGGGPARRPRDGEPLAGAVVQGVDPPVLGAPVPWVRSGSDGWRRWWARRNLASEVSRRRQERQTARHRRRGFAGRRVRISQITSSSGSRGPPPAASAMAVAAIGSGRDEKWIVATAALFV
jgi:hypothetical protein